jgi:hypothetical protein
LNIGVRELAKTKSLSKYIVDGLFFHDLHIQPPYNNHGPVPMTNEEGFIYTGASSDGLIQNNAGQHLMLILKDDDQGYVGTFNVGVNATRSIE